MIILLYTHTHTFMVILLYINIKFILLIKKMVILLYKLYVG